MPHDAVIVAAAFAGLAAAFYLARARRRVCVIDAGQPRNRFAAASHGFLGSDGSEPASILARARAQLATGVRVCDADESIVSWAPSHPDLALTREIRPLPAGER